MIRLPLRRLSTFLGLVVALVATTFSPADARAQAGRGASRLLSVDVLDVGQGDAILIRSPEGKAALIDAGPTRDGAVQALRRRGVESIDLILVTHHHLDHHGGMEAVIDEYHPRYFVATGSSHTTKSWLRLVQKVKDEGITSIQPTG